MKKQGMLLTAFSAMLFGLIPLLTSVLYANGLDAVSVSFYRYVFIVPVLFLLCRLRNISLRITKNEAIFLLVHVSLFSTLTNLLLNASYVYIHTGVATTLHFLYPMFVILICKMCIRDRGQVSGEETEYSLLFIHAQDTIMTINTELRMAQKMMPVFKALYEMNK